VALQIVELLGLPLAIFLLLRPLNFCLIVTISSRHLQLSVLRLVVAVLVSIAGLIRSTRSIIIKLYVFYVFVLRNLFLVSFVIDSSSLISSS
jgi:hypothetical protein